MKAGKTIDDGSCTFLAFYLSKKSIVPIENEEQEHTQIRISISSC